MSIKKHTTELAKAILKTTLVSRMMRAQLTRPQFLFFFIQKALIVKNFESLLSRSFQIAQAQGQHELASVLLSNLDDEQGKDNKGRVNPEAAHKTWRNAFYAALGITDVLLDQTLPLTSAKEHCDAFLYLENTDDVFLIAGAFLALERIIPLEYRGAQISRDHLFPEIFVTRAEDSLEKQEAIRRSRYYIDDHIIHDAKIHFPQLLNVLEKYENDAVAMASMAKGVELIQKVRESFYNEVVSYWVS